MSKSNVVALFAAIPSELSALAIELVKLRAAQNEKADLSALTVEVFTLFSGNVETAEADTQPDEKPLTAAQKKKAAAEKAAADKAAAAEEASEDAGKGTGKKGTAGAKKKPAGKKESAPELDLTPFKEQVGDFLEWLGSDKEDEIAKILEEFDAETADDVADESYTEFYKLVRELTAEEFDLSEVEDLLAA